MMLSNLFVRPPDLSELSIGEAGEKWVSFLYKKNGFKVIETNFEVFAKKKLGEIDLICLRGRDLVFVEVKTRENENFMLIEETLNQKKQNYLRRMVKVYLKKHPEYQAYDTTVDFAGVLIDPFDNSIKSVKIIENIIEDYDASSS